MTKDYGSLNTETTEVFRDFGCLIEPWLVFEQLNIYSTDERIATQQCRYEKQMLVSKSFSDKQPKSLKTSVV
jgi:hypothetical protein